MITRMVATAVLAGSLLFAPALIQRANAGHGGGGHFGGMGGGHFGGMGGGHFGGMGGGHLAEWAVLTLPRMEATSVVRGLARAVGMEATWLPGAWVQEVGMAVLVIMPGTVAMKLGTGMGMDMATITTISSITTASTITLTTASWQLELEDGGQGTGTDMVMAVAAGCITRRWLPAVHIGGIGTTLAWVITEADLAALI